MCEQCTAGAVLVKEQALPGYYLMKAERGSAAWPKGWYGLVQSNDPVMVFPALVRDPLFGLSDEAAAAIQGQTEDEQSYWNAVEAFNRQAPMMPLSGYDLVRACLAVGYSQAEHGTNLAGWLVHHLASQIAEPAPELSKEDVLEAAGWVVECESPFEIRHPDGSFASGQAAEFVYVALRTEQISV